VGGGRPRAAVASSNHGLLGAAAGKLWPATFRGAEAGGFEPRSPQPASTRHVGSKPAAQRVSLPRTGVLDRPKIGMESGGTNSNLVADARRA
jgi:hypothetical protein